MARQTAGHDGFELGDRDDRVDVLEEDSVESRLPRPSRSLEDRDGSLGEEIRSASEVWSASAWDSYITGPDDDPRVFCELPRLSFGTAAGLVPIAATDQGAVCGWGTRLLDQANPHARRTAQTAVCDLRTN